MLFATKQKFLLLFGTLVTLVFSFLVLSGHASAASPSKYEAGVEPQCEWVNAWMISCNGASDSTSHEYYYDIKASESAGHDVFRSEDNTSEFGYLHIEEHTYATNGSDSICLNASSSSLDCTNVVKSVTNGQHRDDQLRGDVENSKAGPDAQNGNDEGRKNICSVIYPPSPRNGHDGKCVNAWGGLVQVSEDFQSAYQKALPRIKSERDCGDPGALNFITCPLLNMINKGVSALIGGNGNGKGLLIDMFYLQPLSFKNVTSAATGQDANPLYTAWDRMKNLALSFYVLIFLFVIFSNSMSLGVDAYTIKKTLPRIMIAALLTQFSFLIISIMIDISNAIGIGLPSFLLAQGPQTFTINISGISGLLGGVVAFIMYFILSLMALFSLIVALITIVARQLVVYLLVILAPIAFAAWVLPNTQKLFQKWWSNLWRVLAMFPMATSIIAAAIMFSRIAGHQAGSGSLVQLTGAMAPLIALAMLPKTFKWGGDFVNFSTGAAIGWLASKWQAGKDKAKGMGKSAAGNARARVALNAGNSRFLHGISGGGFRNNSRKNIVKRGQQQSRIYDEFDKAAAYADKDQLLKLATSGNKGMQKAAIGRMAQTGDINGISSALQSGKVSKATYDQAVGQYFSNFDKMPQMRAVAFNDAGQAQIDTITNSKGQTEYRARVDTGYLDKLSGSAISDMSAASREHIFNQHNIGSVNSAAIDQLRSNSNLGGKLNAGEWAVIDAHFPTQNTTSSTQTSSSAPSTPPAAPPTAPSPPSPGHTPPAQGIGQHGQMWNIPPAPGGDDWTEGL